MPSISWRSWFVSSTISFTNANTKSTCLQRAGKIDYDNWESLGNPGWGWNGLLPYLKKSENYFSPNPEAKFPGGTRAEDSKAKELEHVYRGSKGPLPVRTVQTIRQHL